VDKFVEKEAIMTSLIPRLDPLFNDLDLWNQRLSRMFSRETPARADREEALMTGTWMPPVDIVESKDKISLKAELPGFKENQVELTVEDGVLTLKGERKFEKETNETNYHRVERSYGSFVRSFTLPSNVDQTRIQATFADGVLQIDMPKREETKPKQIKITAGLGSQKDIDVKKTR
jgi:HSP20 family protein